MAARLVSLLDQQRRFQLWILCLLHRGDQRWMVAAAVLVGFARKFTYIGAALFSVLIWAVGEGFGAPTRAARQISALR